MKIKPVCEFTFQGRKGCGQSIQLALASILHPEQGITLCLRNDSIAFCVFSLHETWQIYEYLCRMYPVSENRHHKMNSTIAPLMLSGDDEDQFSISYDNYGDPFEEGSLFEVQGSVYQSCFLGETEARSLRDTLVQIMNGFIE